MTLMEFVGCALTAYGPSLSLFILTIMNDPIRIIILVVSAFFWLVALVVSSLFWNFIAFKHVLPLCVVVSVLVQELFRYFIYLLLREAEQGLKKIRVPNTNMDLLSNKQIVPYVSGLGYGVMNGGFSLGNILAELSGPGTMSLNNPQPYFCLITSVFTLIFTFLHTFWSIILFSALDNKNEFKIVWVICSHLFVSCITLLNQQNLYSVSLTSSILVLVISGYLAFTICRNSRSNQPNIVQNR